MCNGLARLVTAQQTSMNPAIVLRSHDLARKVNSTQRMPHQLQIRVAHANPTIGTVGSTEEWVRVPLGKERINGVRDVLVRPDLPQHSHCLLDGLLLALPLYHLRDLVKHCDNEYVWRPLAKVRWVVHVHPERIPRPQVANILEVLGVWPKLPIELQEYLCVNAVVVSVERPELPSRQWWLVLHAVTLQHSDAERDNGIISRIYLASCCLHYHSTSSGVRDFRDYGIELDLAVETHVLGKLDKNVVPAA
mmetsp:Transcript_66481/g.194526  ORF Transcript_66481/g.194526 Transcript_66481/m.194526 type:complete len:249 (+) Transcript_66481:1072-1818(+)